MWVEDRTPAKDRRQIVRDCGAISVLDGHVIAGWAGLTKQEFARIECVHDVEHSPTEKNPWHGDILKQDFLKIAEGDSSDARRRKANIVAKMLAEAYTQAGLWIELPAPKADASAQLGGLGPLAQLDNIGLLPPPTGSPSDSLPHQPSGALLLGTALVLPSARTVPTDDGASPTAPSLAPAATNERPEDGDKPSPPEHEEQSRRSRD